ncbi:MAG TPA: DMT family transporter [Burkholderiales bacterium]|nr:DMT family transporter [Burkholderiales bacterium]
MAWYFVSVWGSGYLATKIGIQYAAPFTFLSLRYAFGLLCLAPVLALLRPPWPGTPRELGHVVAAGLLMHGIQLSGTHYAQYLGLSAGVVAVILAAQPLLTALAARRWMHERLAPRQWTGVALGLAGVLLVVWHKIDVREMSVAALIAVMTGLVGVTAGTLYQRLFCPTVNLYSAASVQFAASLLVLLPLAFAVEGARVRWAWPLLGSIAFLVVFASIFAVNALHTLMRHGQATKVTSILYFTPIFAVVLEYLIFDVLPSAVTWVGIAITCLGVALVTARGARG